MCAREFAIEQGKGNAGAFASGDCKVDQRPAVTEDDSEDAGQRGKENVIERQNPGERQKLRNYRENEQGDAMPPSARDRDPCRGESEENDQAVLPNLAKIAGWSVQFLHPVSQRELNPAEPSARV